jgi:hypothetical protein
MLVNRDVAARLARYGISMTIAIVLLAGLRLYSFTYFWLDDFTNVYWIRRVGFWELIGHILNPTSLFFRPLGMMVYWILYRVAALHSLPYHVLSWTLHAINTTLLFLLLRKATKSQYAAGLAVLFFAFRANFGDIYWSFANIFQLLALTLVLIALLLYSRLGYSTKDTLALTAIYILAIRAEEQSILLPILWLSYELLIRRNPNWRQWWPRYAVFAVIMGWFLLFKLRTMSAADPTAPYYMDLSVLTFGRGYGWYFNSLYQTNLRWGGWFTLSALLSVMFAIRKNGWALFFVIFTFVTLLPYVFLLNHRFDLYWYMPFVGIAGLMAIAFTALQRIVRKALPPTIVPALLSLVFVVAAVGHYRHEENRTKSGRGYMREVLNEYRVFLRDLRSQPDAATVPMLYYTAIPRHMDETTLLCSTQFALDRIDVETKIVTQCPAQGACIAFENGHLRRIQ